MIGDEFMHFEDSDDCYCPNQNRRLTSPPPVTLSCVCGRDKLPESCELVFYRRFLLSNVSTKLKMPSKLIRILRITFCYKQLCGRCLVHMTPVVKVVIHCVFALLLAKYISDYLIYKEQRACRLTVTSRMSTNTGNRVPLKRMNTTPRL